MNMQNVGYYSLQMRSDLSNSINEISEQNSVLTRSTEVTSNLVNCSSLNDAFMFFLFINRFIQSMLNTIADEPVFFFFSFTFSYARGSIFA